MIEMNYTLLFGQIGLSEILVIAGIAVLLFGAGQIPKVAKSIGEGLKEFKKAIKETKDDDKDDDTAEKDTKDVSKKSTYENKKIKK